MSVVYFPSYFEPLGLFFLVGMFVEGDLWDPAALCQSFQICVGSSAAGEWSEGWSCEAEPCGVCLHAQPGRARLSVSCRESHNLLSMRDL